MQLPIRVWASSWTAAAITQRLVFLPLAPRTPTYRPLMLEQSPFALAEFADNPEPRCACVLLLDTSASMLGDKIRELNEGLRVFQQALHADTLARKRVEVAIVTFGPALLRQGFVSAAQFYAPELQAQGDTPTGAALELALRTVEARKALYREAGVPYYRPWVFLITDGDPTDHFAPAVELLRQGEMEKKFVSFTVGVQGANPRRLAELSPIKPPLMLRGLAFRELFLWLSNSISRTASQPVGSAVHLQNPTEGPEGWAVIIS
jgi:uncharacterized protein YegL